MAFSEALAAAIKYLSLSEEKAADALDVSIPTMRRWLDATTQPRPVVERVTYQKLLQLYQRPRNLQADVARSAELHFKGTTPRERLRDLQHQVAEMAHAPDPATRVKEIGDVGWALLQLATEEGVQFEQCVRATIETLAKREPKRRVALIGTSANPITNAHLTMGLEVLALTDVDEVWYLLVGQHPWGKPLMPAADRLEMARLAVAKYPKLKVSDFEVEHGNEFGETAPFLREKLLPAFPRYEFSWVMGSDVAMTFERWKGHEWMAEALRLIVIHRLGYDWHKEQSILADNRHLYLKEGIVTSNISSSLVRDRGSDEAKLLALVPDPVREYLQEHHLLE